MFFTTLIALSSVSSISVGNKEDDNTRKWVDLNQFVNAKYAPNITPDYNHIVSYLALEMDVPLQPITGFY